MFLPFTKPNQIGFINLVRGIYHCVGQEKRQQTDAGLVSLNDFLKSVLGHREAAGPPV